MDTQIKGYADAVYKQPLMESAVTTRAETTNLLKRRATKKSAKRPLKDIDTQAIINSKLSASSMTAATKTQVRLLKKSCDWNFRRRLQSCFRARHTGKVVREGMPQGF